MPTDEIAGVHIFFRNKDGKGAHKWAKAKNKEINISSLSDALLGEHLTLVGMLH